MSSSDSCGRSDCESDDDLWHRILFGDVISSDDESVTLPLDSDDELLSSFNKTSTTVNETVDETELNNVLLDHGEGPTNLK